MERNTMVRCVWIHAAYFLISVSFKVLSGTSYETDFGSAPLKFCRRAGIALLTHAAKGDDEWVYFMIPAMR